MKWTEKNNPVVAGLFLFHFSHGFAAANQRAGPAFHNLHFVAANVTKIDLPDFSRHNLSPLSVVVPALPAWNNYVMIYDFDILFSIPFFP